ncbi:MAG: ATP-dependent sacrificial sulfur transferase LarE [Saccharofermentanales bacterium]|jgi:uncharacterized protein
MEIREYFEINPHVAIAFSGGVDSAYLLYTASRFAKSLRAYYVKSAFQPQSELEDAKRLSEQLGTELTILPLNLLDDPEITANSSNRCYLCKRIIFSTIIETAQKDGFTIVIDGTNATDETEDRPGMKALQELSIASPLRLCGLDKDEIRRRSKEAGLFTCDKPAYSCLATRIPQGEVITKEKLEKTERAEACLTTLGFSDFRLRLLGTNAKLQLPASQLELALQKRNTILKELKNDYSAVLLDLEARDE